MRRFYQLRDDLEIPGRWHLGEVRSKDGSEPLLDAGQRLETGETLTAEVNKPGRVLDFSLTSFAVPIATAGLARAVRAVAGPDVQCVPVRVAGQSGMEVLNSVRVLRCLDERRSEFIKWTEKDHRADLAGQYRQVTRLVLEARSIPEDAHFFRVDGWVIALIVSEAVKAAMQEVGCVGAKFSELALSS